MTEQAAQAERNPRLALSRAALAHDIAACRICAAHLPLGPRPLVRGHITARLLIISQAPGTRAHETGLSFNDQSGERLRDWLGLSRTRFYDEDLVAIMPMGFCYPGRLPNGGDRPPRPECAPLWHGRLRAHWPGIGLTLLVGSYAITHYLGTRRRPSMTETVVAWTDYAPQFLPLPHPSWRTTAWERKNQWFRGELIPVLRHQVATLLGD
jgi:uracil-DNA glycosylase